MKKLLAEQIVEKQGSFKKVKRWYKGKGIGKLLRPEETLSHDWETEVSIDVIEPIKTFEVKNEQ